MTMPASRPRLGPRKPRLLLIDGQHVPSASGRTFKTLNPATEQVIATVAEGNEADVDRAVAAARRAFEGPWRTMRASERGQILLRLADLMKQHADEIAALESLDAGKPIAGVLRQDLPAAIDTLTYYAGWADKISGEVVSTRDDALTYTVREPVGVVAAIVPWNFPLMIGMWKLAPALACGCTDRDEAGRADVAFGVAHRRAGARSRLAARRSQYRHRPRPRGRRRAGQSSRCRQGDLHRDRRASAAAFCAAPPAISNACRSNSAASPPTSSSTMPIIEAATKAAASGIFFNAGQVCSAGSRVLAHEKVYDEVVERLTQRAQVDPHRRSRRSRHGAGPGHLRKADEERPRLRRYRPRRKARC